MKIHSFFILIVGDPHDPDPDAPVVIMVWRYVPELVFNMLALLHTG